MKLTLNKQEKKNWIQKMKERKMKAAQERNRIIENYQKIREIIKSENSQRMKISFITNLFSTD